MSRTRNHGFIFPSPRAAILSELTGHRNRPRFRTGRNAQLQGASRRRFEESRVEQSLAVEAGRQAVELATVRYTEDRADRNERPWEKDIQLLRDARLGISEYAPGSQGKWLKDKHTQFEPDLVPTFGPGRKDFHDRRIVFFPDEKNPRKRITVLMTGGIDRYLDPKFECSVVTQFAV